MRQVGGTQVWMYESFFRQHNAIQVLGIFSQMSKININDIFNMSYDVKLDYRAIFFYEVFPKTTYLRLKTASQVLTLDFHGH